MFAAQTVRLFAGANSEIFPISAEKCNIALGQIVFAGANSEIVCYANSCGVVYLNSLCNKKIIAEKISLAIIIFK